MNLGQTIPKTAPAPTARVVTRVAAPYGPYAYPPWYATGAYAPPPPPTYPQVSYGPEVDPIPLFQVHRSKKQDNSAFLIVLIAIVAAYLLF